MFSGSSDTCVRVRAPARLHFTLVDMNGESGRLDGSVGVALDSPALDVVVRRLDGDNAAPTRVPAHVAAELESTRARLGLGSVPIHVDVAADIPRHSGLGSGTQWRLAWVSALNRVCNLGLDPVECAARSGRGGTSGIGIYAFRHGGVLVDGGHRRGCDKAAFAPSAFAEGISPPPLLARVPFPEEWRIALYVPSALRGLSGHEERQFMADNTPLPKAECAAVSHLVLMGLLPALIERDFAAFTHAVSELQVVGWKRRHWLRPQLAPMAAVRHALAQANIAGCGLSSTGPTVFGFVDATRHDVTAVERHLRRILERDPSVPPGEVRITKANNTGAQIHPIAQPVAQVLS